MEHEMALKHTHRVRLFSMSRWNLLGHLLFHTFQIRSQTTLFVSWGYVLRLPTSIILLDCKLPAYDFIGMAIAIW